ncbi:hypothetical protein BABINDRAFT_111324 [Babjeviella inositovora NRRL Y-12698]|uniref:Response regulatory domain-containing protein n=1 Tax=Babjeviella inositovora NRRL Y-12698 TaxID=984486 RepID=A0A1E3QVT3_9ASCO|nr:uncharacterized protein BABINDRAFT_111324 [Babjeviella inositovora NRRL Y-12698]ODQ81775.1 hypothetical protein BABINDRAFT_111324 [Babjeviella inositovora NRRL Y-12698]
MERRVWVKKHNGHPTCIRVASADIVDDLKSRVMEKYPTSIAQQCDPADLVIRLVYPQWTTSTSMLNTGPTYRRPGQPSQAVLAAHIKREATTSPLSPAPSALKKPVFSSLEPPGLTAVLEPDQVVGKLLDHYFPNGMGMSDAFLIEYPQSLVVGNASGSQASQNLQGFQSQSFQTLGFPNQITPRQASFPGPSPCLEHGLVSPNPVYPNLTIQQMQQSLSPVAALNPPPIHRALLSSPRSASVAPSQTLTRHLTLPNQSIRGANAHTRALSSESTPSKGSTPVLLLPRNFTLSGASTSPTEGKKRPEKLSLQPLAEIVTPSEKSPLDLPAKFLGGLEDIQRNSLPNLLSDSNLLPGSGPLPALDVGLPASIDISRFRNSSNELTKKKSANKGKKPSTTDKVLPRIRVLIVEDNKVNIRILSMFMRQRNISYALANNGQEAIDRWREGGFHLVLMDIQLPVISGIGATIEIRRLERINKIGVFAENDGNEATFPVNMEDFLPIEQFRSPVIIVALTASTMDRDKTDALAAGCNDFLTKPVKHEWLQNKIIEWGCMQALIDFDSWKFSSRDEETQPPLPLPHSSKVRSR